MLKADKNGLITHTYPTNLFEKINESGEFLSVDTRFYFKEAKKTHEPVVSDVFQGRGFGNDPLIALSAPLFDKNRFDGIIEASLDLKNFRELDKKLIADEQSLLIIDNTNRVIYHSAETEYQFLQNYCVSVGILRHRFSQKIRGV